MTLAHWLERTAQAHPNLPAVAVGATPYRSYRDLAQASAALAGWLRQAGVSPADRVAVVCENRPELFEVLFGVWRLGAAVATIPSDLPPPAMAAALADADVCACIASPKAAVVAAEHMPARHSRLLVIGGFDYRRALAADPIPIAKISRAVPAWLAYDDVARPDTPPAAVALSHHALMHIALSFLAEVEVSTPRDAIVHAGPMTANSGLYALTAVARGGVNVATETGGFDPAELFDVGARWRRASVLAPPSMLRAMTSSGADCDPTAFRTILIDGEAAAPEDKIDALNRFGPRIAQVYGRPEFPLAIARLSKHDVAARGDPAWPRRTPSVGRGFLTAQLQVRDEDGTPLEQDALGEIHVQGPAAMLGYWRAPEATRAAFVDDWLKTGDLGRIDAGGYVTIEGPIADSPIIDARRAPPRPIERAVRAHPDVAAAAATPRGPSAPPAVYVALASDVERDAPTADGDDDRLVAELDAWCRARLAPTDRPAEIVLTTELPTRPNGAIDLVALAALDAARRTASAQGRGADAAAERSRRRQNEMGARSGMA